MGCSLCEQRGTGEGWGLSVQSQGTYKGTVCAKVVNQKGFNTFMLSQVIF